NNNLFWLITWAFKALNSRKAGNKSSRLAPTGWIIKSAFWAISKVAWLVRAGASMIIKSYCLVKVQTSFTWLNTWLVISGVILFSLRHWVHSQLVFCWWSQSANKVLIFFLVASVARR